MGRSSSSPRKKKRSKVRTSKRSRKYGSKKLRRHVSDDDDDSRSSMSSSSYSSSSEDSKYRSSKRSRVRVKKRVVRRKKKARKRSYSSESSDDDRCARKRVVSKRKRDLENKHKMYSKKKRRRDDSVSSTSPSWSCSSRRSDSVSSHEVGPESSHKKHGREERDDRDLEKVERASKRIRYRSTSPLCSERLESGEYWMNDKVSVENNSRRLRSVITVVERDEEDREINQDVHKEELVYDLDDYPSCRSNESNDTGRQREEGDNGSSIDREKKVRLENAKGDNTVVSILRPHKEVNNDDLSNGDDADEFHGSKRHSYEFGKANTVNKKMSDVSRSIGETNSDDLESILRQRALENLRKFRGVMRTDERTADGQKGQIESDTNQSPSANAESAPVRSTVEDGSKTVCANSTVEDSPKVVISAKTRLTTGIRVPEPEKASQIDENVTNRNTGHNETLSAKQKVASSINRTEVAGNSNEKVKVGISAAKPKLDRPALTRQLLKSNSTLSQAPGQQEPQTELLATGNKVHRTSDVTASTSIENPENNGVDISNAGNSAVAEPSSPSSDKPKDEANEGSQLEQKTMSVMRGGEMVQVTYKVYIPKKAPASARRQLKR